jgi:hypothetical protein
MGHLTVFAEMQNSGRPACNGSNRKKRVVTGEKKQKLKQEASLAA